MHVYHIKSPINPVKYILFFFLMEETDLEDLEALPRVTNSRACAFNP